MDVREKLAEMIFDSINLNMHTHTACNLSTAVADDLISRGVTVQEWISVTEKLPEVVSTHKRYRNTIKKSTRVLCACVQKSGKTMIKEGYCEWHNDYPEPRWQIPGTIDEVTHWQYLPQPPKGE